tara:strand:- start:1216 stop:2289 length:1074 start_codon:yes stop_codon:yes gene_type:complete
MKILLDIGHPAHVHYFKNLIKLMIGKGHSFLIIARDKEVAHQLLDSYSIDYKSRGSGRKNYFSKIIYMIWVDILLLRLAFKFKPDIFLSFASPYAAQTSWLYRKPHISLTDTEHAKIGNLAFIPFSKVVLTPESFLIDLGKKHIKFNSYMELSYLHPKYYKPNPQVLKILGLSQNEKFVLLRFVSWSASHDVGQSGLDDRTKIELIEKIKKYAKVFISSESVLPKKFQKYKINISPHQMHDVLSYASLYIGEGATMASECAVLGTPAIYINSLEVGYCSEQEKHYGLLYGFRNSKGVSEKALELINTKNLKELHKLRCGNMIDEKIDLTAFLIWFIENYPQSYQVIKKNPDYQYTFK